MTLTKVRIFCQIGIVHSFGIKNDLRALSLWLHDTHPPLATTDYGTIKVPMECDISSQQLNAIP